MPITSKIEGNLITLAQSGKYKAIVHGCNCFCVMGAGIAPQIAKAFPWAERVDYATQTGDKRKLGSFSYSHDFKVGLKVINAYTQYGTGGRAKGLPDINYPALAKVFASINDKQEHDFRCDPRPIGVPMIGAGLAGGHWEAIETIINLVTPDLSLELVIYDPNQK